MRPWSCAAAIALAAYGAARGASDATIIILSRWYGRTVG